MKQYIATVDLAMYLDMANFMGWCDDQTSSSHPCPLDSFEHATNGVRALQGKINN